MCTLYVRAHVMPLAWQPLQQPPGRLWWRYWDGEGRCTTLNSMPCTAHCQLYKLLSTIGTVCAQERPTLNVCMLHVNASRWHYVNWVGATRRHQAPTLVLSGQRRSGAKRIRPPSHPPRPSQSLQVSTMLCQTPSHGWPDVVTHATALIAPVGSCAVPGQPTTCVRLR